jgi:hypothetical protein
MCTVSVYIDGPAANMDEAAATHSNTHTAGKHKRIIKPAQSVLILCWLNRRVHVRPCMQMYIYMVCLPDTCKTVTCNANASGQSVGHCPEDIDEHCTCHAYAQAQLQKQHARQAFNRKCGCCRIRGNCQHLLPFTGSMYCWLQCSPICPC